jgi:hypothetical protein
MTRKQRKRRHARRKWHRLATTRTAAVLGTTLALTGPAITNSAPTPDDWPDHGPSYFGSGLPAGGTAMITQFYERTGPPPPQRSMPVVIRWET